MTIDRARACGVILLVCLLASVRAGERMVIQRKGGGAIEGELVGQSNSHVRLKTRFGTVEIKRVDILSMREGRTPLTQYHQRRKTVDPADAQALLELAAWAEEKRLFPEALATYLAASEVAGPHYLEARMQLAAYAMRSGEYRLAVVTWSELAGRLKHRGAREALRRAEERLRQDRLDLLKRARTAFEEERFDHAVILFGRTLELTLREETLLDVDVGRRHLAERIRASRRALTERMKTSGCPVALQKSSPGHAGWIWQRRPPNLRGRAEDITFEELQVNLERNPGRWLAVRGAYRGHAEYETEDVLSLRLAEEPHPALGVAIYRKDEEHRATLQERRKDAHLQELVDDYPYEELPRQVTTLMPGQTLVCYGRLLRRSGFVPPFVLEVWALDAVAEPDAQRLAQALKKPLRCRFNGTSLAEVVDFVALVTGLSIQFEDEGAADIAIELVCDGKPTGYVVSRLAAASGLEWTRHGDAVLMKRTLDRHEQAMRDQVIRLATDKGAR